MADAILYYDESEDELAYDQGAAFFLALLGLDADLATLSLPASTTISAFGASIIDDANAAAVIATLGLDADLATFALPASTTISAYGASLIDDAAAANARTTLELGSTDSPVFVTVKLSGLTDDYIPYHVDDSTGFANGPTKTNVDSAVSLKHTQNTDSGTTGNTFTVDSDSTTGKFIFDVALGAADKSMTFTNNVLTDDRTITFPNASGTVSLGGGSAHTILDEDGDAMTARANLKFTGTGSVTTDDAGNDTTIVTITAGAGSGHTIIDENGDPMTARSNLEFTGTGVAVTDVGGTNTVVTITAGGGLTVADLQKYGLM